MMFKEGDEPKQSTKQTIPMLFNGIHKQNRKFGKKPKKHQPKKDLTKRVVIEGQYGTSEDRYAQQQRQFSILEKEQQHEQNMKQMFKRDNKGFKKLFDAEAKSNKLQKMEAENTDANRRDAANHAEERKVHPFQHQQHQYQHQRGHEQEQEQEQPVRLRSEVMYALRNHVERYNHSVSSDLLRMVREHKALVGDRIIDGDKLGFDKNDPERSSQGASAALASMPTATSMVISAEMANSRVRVKKHYGLQLKQMMEELEGHGQEAQDNNDGDDDGDYGDYGEDIEVVNMHGAQAHLDNTNTSASQQQTEFQSKDELMSYLDILTQYMGTLHEKIPDSTTSFIDSIRFPTRSDIYNAISNRNTRVNFGASFEQDRSENLDGYIGERIEWQDTSQTSQQFHNFADVSGNDGGNDWTDSVDMIAGPTSFLNPIGGSKHAAHAILDEKVREERRYFQYRMGLVRRLYPRYKQSMAFKVAFDTKNMANAILRISSFSKHSAADQCLLAKDVTPVKALNSEFQRRIAESNDPEEIAALRYVVPLGMEVHNLTQALTAEAEDCILTSSMSFSSTGEEQDNSSERTVSVKDLLQILETNETSSQQDMEVDNQSEDGHTITTVK